MTGWINTKIDSVECVDRWKIQWKSTLQPIPCQSINLYPKISYLCKWFQQQQQQAATAHNGVVKARSEALLVLVDKLLHVCLLIIPTKASAWPGNTVPCIYPLVTAPVNVFNATQCGPLAGVCCDRAWNKQLLKIYNHGEGLYKMILIIGSRLEIGMQSQRLRIYAN